jgi:dTDP-4-dehydrorhamnose reductase
MKTLVLGCKGQLGQSLAGTVPEDIEIIGFDLPELDITDNAAVIEICRQHSPDVIVNAAAYTAVDQAESEPEIAASVNIDGTRNIAAAAHDVGAKLIHISTDYVFDGESTNPYKPDDVTNPLGVYGQTKRDGELAALKETSGSAVIIRTAWLYSKTGSNFVKTMLRLMDERDELSVVADQFGTPTWADSLANAVWGFARAPQHSGVFHWTDGGKTSWHGFATTIQEEALSLGLLSKAIPIHAVSTKDYPTATKRPTYTVLDCSATHDAINIQPAKWQANLRQMLKGMSHVRHLAD